MSEQLLSGQSDCYQRTELEDGSLKGSHPLTANLTAVSG